MSNGSQIFRQNMLSQFNGKNVNNNKLSNKLDNKRKNISVKFSNLPTSVPIGLLSPVSLRPSKENLNKSKFYKKKEDKLLLNNLTCKHL